jgi:hypothetical protein
MYTYPAALRVPPRHPLAAWLFWTTLAFSAVTLALGLSGLGAFLWPLLSGSSQSAAAGGQALSGAFVLALATAPVGLVAVVLGLVAVRREPLPGAESRHPWIAAALAASFACTALAGMFDLFMLAFLWLFTGWPTSR